METITLDYPITVDGAEVKKLSMRRPKVKDQLASDKSGGSDGDKEVRLFANLCEVAPAVIEDLDMIDYGKVQEQYRSFLSSRPKK